MTVTFQAIVVAAAIVGMSSADGAARHYFYAACYHESHGILGYNGPRHADAAVAQRDCAAHLKIYPRHRCRIAPIDY